MHVSEDIAASISKGSGVLRTLRRAGSPHFTSSVGFCWRETCTLTLALAPASRCAVGVSSAPEKWDEAPAGGTVHA